METKGEDYNFICVHCGFIFGRRHASNPDSYDAIVKYVLDSIKHLDSRPKNIGIVLEPLVCPCGSMNYHFVHKKFVQQFMKGGND